MGGHSFHSLSLDDGGDEKMETCQKDGSNMGQMAVNSEYPQDSVNGNNGKGLWQIATSRSRNGKFHARDSRRPRQDSFEVNHAHKGQEKRPRMTFVTRDGTSHPISISNLKISSTSPDIRSESDDHRGGRAGPGVSCDTL
eukprot:746214-Hanusia_phi.AAC.7